MPGRGVQCQGRAVPGPSVEQHPAVLQNTGPTSKVLLSRWPNWINGSVALLLKSDSNQQQQQSSHWNFKSLFIYCLFVYSYLAFKENAGIRITGQILLLGVRSCSVWESKNKCKHFSFEGVCVVWQRHPGLRGVHSHAYVASVADIRISS